MDIITHIKEAFNNLFTAKLRTFLAVLGILIGIASVVGMVSSGQLATEHALEQFKVLGTDLLSVSISASQSGKDSDGDKPKLKPADILTLPSKISEIRLAAPLTSSYVDMSFDGHKINGSIIGATEGLEDVAKIQMESGRFISAVEGYAYNCVIGHEIHQQIKKFSLANPIGQQLKIGDYFYTIIGIAADWPENSFIPDNINRSVIVPIETSLLLSKYTNINNIVFSLYENVDIQGTQDQITQTIDNLVPHTNLYFRSPQEIINSMASQRQTLTILLGLIGGISLLVGGIGVMNIMLVSVVERRKEIGIRLAIGARRRDIQLMFLIESITLTLFGGVLGVIIGIFIAFIICLYAGWHFQIYYIPPLVGFTVAAAIGIFFGFYPAYQASRLDPIETLRTD